MPSFKLSNRKGHWWVTWKNPVNGVEHEFDTGTGHREKAEGIAEALVPQKIAMARATSSRHKARRKTAEGVKQAVGSATNGVAPTATPAPVSSDPPSPAPAPAPPVDEARAAEIASKLRSLGDAQPIPADDEEPAEPDEVIPPTSSGPAGAPPSSTDEGDNEAGEFLADVISVGIVTGTVRSTTAVLKSMKPPRRPAVPDEKMVEWYRAGLAHHLKRMLGNAGTLGPTGKMCLGCAGVIISMCWSAEIVEPAPKPAATAAPSNGVHQQAPAPAPKPAQQEAPSTRALGRFS